MSGQREGSAEDVRGAGSVYVKMTVPTPLATILHAPGPESSKYTQIFWAFQLFKLKILTTLSDTLNSTCQKVKDKICA